MILNDLVRYYERKLEAGEISPPGFEMREIPYLIEIDKKGAFVQFTSTWMDEKQKRARSFRVPHAVKRSSGVAANLLWDTCAYVFGVSPTGKDSKADRLAKQKDEFQSRIDVLAAGCEDEGLQAVVAFLKSPAKQLLKSLQKDPLWEEIVESGRNLSFKLNTENRLVCERAPVRRAIEKLEEQMDANAPQGVCAITGEQDEIAVTHAAIQGVRGAQSSGGNIVSFNQSAFTSFGKEQGLNAPVGQRAAFAYTTALNTLLGKDSTHKIQLADTSVIFWAEESHSFEHILAGLFSEPHADSAGDARAHAEANVRAFYDAYQTGKRPLEKDATGFHVLGIAPNISRLSIRFYYTGTVGDIARNLHQHFEDLQLKGSPTDRSYPSLDHLMRATAVRGERERIHPLLAAQCIQAILSGGLYPRILLSATLSRLAHDHDSHSRHYYDHARCALIKASLNRMRARRPEYCNFEEVQETMDESNMNTEYRLGRLFAVLEHVQRKALGLEINRTIRDRYFSSAATRPAQVFPVIVNLAQHHLSKLKHKGNQIYFEKIIQNILEPVKEYPHGNVSLEGQGLFTLGYYHQKQDLFKKKESGEEVEEEQEQED